MSHIANKIVAQDKALHSIFSETRYRIDTFQREFRWQHKQIDALISDLTISFLTNYSPDHTLADVDSYDCYYMGPIVLCEDGHEMSIVDGQQRLTSFTLLMLHLRYLQKKHNLSEEQYKELNNYIYVSRAGRKSFSLDVPSRAVVMKYLYNLEGESLDYSILDNCDKDKESNENLLHCFDDISHTLPSELETKEVLPLFIEWLLYKVVIVEIKAFNIDNAYTIFETMNDRGLSLNPTEILKAFVLSKIKDETKSEEMNHLWKECVSNIKYASGSDGDMLFFRAWFRAKYARDISSGKVNEEKEDFELIGSQFHTWFKNNQKLVHLSKPDDFYYFVKSDFSFYSEIFIRVQELQRHEDANEKNQFFITACNPMADSLYYILLFASILPIDNSVLIKEKLAIVNQFVDIFINRRILLLRSVAQSSIRRTIFEIVKKIRNVELQELSNCLQSELDKYDTSDLVSKNNSYTQNFMHYLYARIRFHLRCDDSFSTLLRTRRQSSFVLTQIFTEEEWKRNMISEETNISPWSVFNYCLCKRADAKNLPEDIGERIRFMIKNNYMPEMLTYKYSYPVDFVIKRSNTIEQIVKNEIWNNSLESTQNDIQIPLYLF